MYPHSNDTAQWQSALMPGSFLCGFQFDTDRAGAPSRCRLHDAVGHDKARVLFLDSPRRREATFSHITTPCELGNTPSVPSLAMRRGSGGVPKKGYPRCESVEKKKTASIGDSPWNMLGGNSENFIRPQTCRRGCTLYSQRSVGGRERCAEKISVSRMAE